MINTANTPIHLPSLIDNDLYKFTMQQGAFELFRGRKARHRFINRGNETFTPEMITRLRASIDAMAELRLLPEEKVFLGNEGLFKGDYLDYLEEYRYNPAQVNLELNPKGQLEMTIEGPWEEEILWEVPLMALISQVYLDATAPLSQAERTGFRRRTLQKALQTRETQLVLSEFGTRRRRDFESHEDVVRTFACNAGPSFVGTSNVHLAMKYGLKPIGTMAHEWVMAHAAIFGVEKANPKALDSWRKIYPNKLKIFLPDTYTTDLALATLSDEQIRYLDGFRWDSADPYEFTHKVAERMKKAGIALQERKIVYSDSLTMADAVRIQQNVRGKVHDGYGIGTHLTNDYTAPALRIVIKLDALCGVDVAKTSDMTAKASGSAGAVTNAMNVIDNVLNRKAQYEMA